MQIRVFVTNSFLWCISPLSFPGHSRRQDFSQANTYVYKPKWLQYISINRAAMGRARFLIYPWFINRASMRRTRFLIYPWFIVFVINQTSLGQNSNNATYDVQGQQKSQITKLTLCKKRSIQKPNFEAIYHFGVNSYLISAVVKSIP